MTRQDAMSTWTSSFDLLQATQTERPSGDGSAHVGEQVTLPGAAGAMS